MRDLKKEIENAKKQIRQKQNCCGISCGECAIGAMTDLYGVSHRGLVDVEHVLGNEYVAAERRWLRGWLAMATGKWFSE